MTEKIALDRRLADEIVRIILSHKKASKILLFGSRARQDGKKTSDIDIAIVDRDWSGKDINLVKNALEDQLKTPLMIDVVNFYTLGKPELKDRILKEGKVLYGSNPD